MCCVVDRTLDKFVHFTLLHFTQLQEEYLAINSGGYLCVIEYIIFIHEFKCGGTLPREVNAVFDWSGLPGRKVYPLAKKTLNFLQNILQDFCLQFSIGFSPIVFYRKIYRILYKTIEKSKKILQKLLGHTKSIENSVEFLENCKILQNYVKNYRKIK